MDASDRDEDRFFGVMYTAKESNHGTNIDKRVKQVLDENMKICLFESIFGWAWKMRVWGFWVLTFPIASEKYPNFMLFFGMFGNRTNREKQDEAQYPDNVLKSGIGDVGGVQDVDCSDIKKISRRNSFFKLFLIRRRLERCSKKQN